MSELKIINTKEQYEEALGLLSNLMDGDPEQGSSEADKLEVLSLLIEDYEERTFDFELPDPVDAIKFRMDQMNLKNKDMTPYFGSKARVSEVLNRKRPLTLPMMRSLHAGLGISADTLLRESTATSLVETTGWQGFPIKEMFKRGFFHGVYSSVKEVIENEEQAIWNVLNSVNEPNLKAALLRTSAHSHERCARSMDARALAAWSVKVFQKVEESPLQNSYEPGCIDDEFVKDLVKLSQYESGPQLAVEFLHRHGIHLVAVSHLNKTYLDGAAFMSAKGGPVIALTLRFDRIDNFWFVLLHELAHVKLHLDNKEKQLFFDDLESRPDTDKLEGEADQFALNALIPEAVWNDSDVKVFKDQESARNLANKLGIHPAIVVGRLQREESNYRLLSKSIGRGQDQVRGHFPGFDS